MDGGGGQYSLSVQQYRLVLLSLKKRFKRTTTVSMVVHSSNRQQSGDGKDEKNDPSGV